MLLGLHPNLFIAMNPGILKANQIDEATCGQLEIINPAGMKEILPLPRGDALTVFGKTTDDHKPQKRLALQQSPPRRITRRHLGIYSKLAASASVGAILKTD